MYGGSRYSASAISKDSTRNGEAILKQQKGRVSEKIASDVTVYRSNLMLHCKEKGDISKERFDAALKRKSLLCDGAGLHYNE